MFKIKIREKADLKTAFKEHAFPATTMSGHITDWPSCLAAASPVIVIINKTSGYFER